MKNLSIKFMAGQRLMVGFDGTDLNEDVKFLIKNINAGGLILFSRNIETPEQVKNLCDSAQNYAASLNLPPLFIAVDQEGGQVARLKPPYFTEFPGNPFMTQLEDADHFAKITASELKQVGINMNMAPVMDVAPQEMDSIMSGRVFGHDPKWVAQMGCRVIKGLQSQNILAAAKHFPGIGRTILDSHKKLPIMNKDAESIENFDCIPFKAAIEQNVAGIMLSHILYPKLDPKWPASLSPAIVKHLLREQMGFDGLVMTDDLDMGAVQNYDIRTSISQIMAADVDIALICHKGPNIETAFEEIVKAMNHNADILKQAQICLKRILGLKMQYL